eukprot:Nk52_evm3s213 gene=Nk52_evmTU3s213
MMPTKGLLAKRCAVYGGSGALGAHLVKHFRSLDWDVLSIDVKQNEQASMNVVVDPSLPFSEQAQQIERGVIDKIKKDKLDAIYCVAGGWAGGNASSDDLVKNTDLMLKQSLWTSVTSARLAALHLKDNGGILQLTGAQPALEGTPGMIGYGAAKAAVHQLVKSLANPSESGLPNGTKVLCILPNTLDTPMNRKFMSDADFSSWTPLDFVAQLFTQWAEEPSKAPESGSLCKLNTSKGDTKVSIVN